MYYQNKNNEEGLVLISVLFVITVATSIITAYMTVARIDLKIAAANNNSQSGFNIAEAGLNVRAKEIKIILQGQERPAGTSPRKGMKGCDDGRIGSEDYKCIEHELGGFQKAVSYIDENPDNPILSVIPPGELFDGLSALEYRYTVTSVGRDQHLNNEAILKLEFTSRAVPMFQFAAFFAEDLEFFAGATLSINGPVHTNGDLYLSSQTGGSLNFSGGVTAAGDIFRGMKTVNNCSGQQGTISILNPFTFQGFYSCNNFRQKYTNNDFSNWGQNIASEIKPLILPSVSDLKPFNGGTYWAASELRLVLKLDENGNPDTSLSSTGVVITDVDNNILQSKTNALNDKSRCPSIDNHTGGHVVGSRGNSYNNRLRLYREYQHDSLESNYERTLEIDTQKLFRCINDENLLDDAKRLDDGTDGGLVFYFTIEGPKSNASHNNYAVRLRNSSVLQSDTSYAYQVKGVTIVTDQKIVVWGDYNSDPNKWIPSALIADNHFLLSNNWKDTTSEVSNRYYRVGSNTTVRAAILSGIKRSGNANGAAGRDKGADTNGGGVINTFRFNEWFRCDSRRGSSCSSGQRYPDFVYDGSFVSLGPPQKSQSSWGPFSYYSAPNRVWSFDTRFNNIELIPPLTPNFIYLTQELFSREYHY